MAYRITLLEQQIRDAERTMRNPRSKEVLATILASLQTVHTYENEAWKVEWVAAKDVAEYRKKRAEQLGKTVIPLQEMKIVLAKNETIEYLEDRYPELVASFMTDIIGHPEALITDESEIRDFFLYEESWDEFQSRAVGAGLTNINREDSIPKVINDWITLHTSEKSNIVQFKKSDKLS
jgi:hypothetical protein